MTAVAELRAQLEHLDTTALEHLGHALLARAAARRQRLTPEEARAALDDVELRLGSGSQFESLLRARAAARRLVIEGWHPEQVAQPLTDECALLCGQCERLGLHVDAVAAGISDALEVREVGLSVA
jgi:hypothetical protein